jgi:hypothetical protein
MGISGIVISILWAIMSLVVIAQYGPACRNISPAAKIVVGLIFIIGGPIFVASSAFELILSNILPEGWNDDEDDDFKKH